MSSFLGQARNFCSKHSLDYYFNASCVTHRGRKTPWKLSSKQRKGTIRVDSKNRPEKIYGNSWDKAELFPLRHFWGNFPTLWNQSHKNTTCFHLTLHRWWKDVSRFSLPELKLPRNIFHVFCFYPDLSFLQSQKLLNILNVKLVIVSGKQSCLSTQDTLKSQQGSKGGSSLLV